MTLQNLKSNIPFYTAFGQLKKTANGFIEQAPISNEEKVRLHHYTVFLMIGIPTLVVYGCYNILYGSILLSGFVFSSAIGIGTGWFLLRKQKTNIHIFRGNIFLYAVLLLYMFVIGGTAASKSLWMFTFPLTSFFLFGKKEGIIWSTIILLLCGVFFWLPAPFINLYNYHSEFKPRFVSAYLLVMFFTYWFEHFRNKYRMGMEQEQLKLQYEKQLLEKEIAERIKAEKENTRLIKELEETLNVVKSLQGLLPICANCHNIRDDKGYWNKLELYLKKHSDVEFSHGICPDCAEKMLSNLDR